MALLAIAYPKLDKKDYDWIQEYRSKNDPRYFSVIDPHFTLVFAVHDFDTESFVSEVNERVENIPKFNFTLRVATINQDDSGEYFHEFLVPDEGYSNIIKLHDKLYSGKFANYLRYDIDFIPHIGIGNDDDKDMSKKRIDQLNNSEINIPGSIDIIDVIEYKNGNISTISQTVLK